MSDEEAQAAYDDAPEVPLSDERIKEIVRYATDDEFREKTQRKFGAWSFLRSVLSQGAAIQQDYMAGNLSGYEMYSARLDAAARERDDELFLATGRTPSDLAEQVKMLRDVTGRLLVELEDYVVFGDGHSNGVSAAMRAAQSILAATAPPEGTP